jgi:non-ribosomal peptide synthetase-like protein
MALLLWLKWIEAWRPDGLDPAFFLVGLPLISIAVAAGLAGLVLAMKWILLGRVKTGQHPLWSCWCSRWDFLYVAWGVWARGILRNFEGTLWLNWWLRAMGVTIGRRVLLGGGFSQVVDPDMLNFEDEATVAGMFQAHSFEDRVLKTAPVHIRQGATTRAGSVLLYGADIGTNACVGEHSVVMKHEVLPTLRYYVGCPTQPANPPDA